MQADRYGLPLTTASPAAAAAYQDGIDGILSAWPGADTHLQKALDEEPGVALAHAAMGRLHQMYARMPQARGCVEKARALAASATPRERAHVEILGHAIEGRPPRALEALLPHLEEWPRDAFAFSLALGAFGLYAFGGRADHDSARLALCERHARHYGNDDWWFLTYLGWSNTEAGRLKEGEAHTARSLELRADNAHGAHAMAHWHAEADDLAGGAAFLERWQPRYTPEGMLWGHVSWHSTLAWLEANEPARALACVRERLLPEVNLGPPINRISDAASLLWRIGLRDPVDPELWAPLRRYVDTQFPGPAPHFIEWHVALVLAATHDEPAAEQRLADLHARESSGALPTGGTLEAVCRGIAAYGRGDRREAAAQLSRSQPDWPRLGGSGAQRRLLAETLTASS